MRGVDSHGRSAMHGPAVNGLWVYANHRMMVSASFLPQIKRTEGVSTTDIVGRMLTCTRVNPFVAGDEVR